jgi:hypothetical protein
VTVAACGGNQPDVRRVSADAADDVQPAAVSAGAELEVDGTKIVAPPRSTTTIPPIASQEERVIAASKNVVPSYFDALAANDFDKALELASGNALTLVEAIRQNGRCGVQITGMTRTAPTIAKAVGKDVFHTDATATLDFTSGAHQAITAVYVAGTKRGAYLVDDFDVGTTPLHQLLDTGRNDRAELEVRASTLELCVGPGVAAARMSVVNESDAPIKPNAVFYRKTTGETVPITTGVETILEPLDPGETTTWDFAVEGSDLCNGSFVIYAPDLEGLATDEMPQRAWPLVVPRFFSGA